MNFLKPDSPLMRALSVLADLMILNILTLLLCIPVVTAGAAFTAMHYVLLKMVRNREGQGLREVLNEPPASRKKEVKTESEISLVGIKQNPLTNFM